LEQERGKGSVNDELSDSRSIVSVPVTVCVLNLITSSLDTVVGDELMSIVLVGLTVDEGAAVLAKGLVITSVASLCLDDADVAMSVASVCCEDVGLSVVLAVLLVGRTWLVAVDEGVMALVFALALLLELVADGLVDVALVLALETTVLESPATMDSIRATYIHMHKNQQMPT
jgi:hypothetical protein